MYQQYCDFAIIYKQGATFITSIHMCSVHIKCHCLFCSYYEIWRGRIHYNKQSFLNPLADSTKEPSDKTLHPLPMRECHPALHLGGCTANQTSSCHALQPTNQSAQQHLIKGMTDNRDIRENWRVCGRVGGLQGTVVSKRTLMNVRLYRSRTDRLDKADKIM